MDTRKLIDNIHADDITVTLVYDDTLKLYIIEAKESGIVKRLKLVTYTDKNKALAHFNSYRSK